MGSGDAPKLFDRALRARRRDRAASTAAKGARFSEAAYLNDEAAQGIAERLAPITRAFPEAAVFGAADGRYAAALAGRFGIERLRSFETAPGLAAQGGAAVGDLDPSPLASESVDLIVAGLELHAVDDPVGALIQARRALRPDGVFLGCLFAGETLQELRGALAAAEAEIEGGLSPRVAPMADLRALGGLLQRAGFALPVADADRITVWLPSPLHLMRDLRAMGESNALIGRRRGFLRRDLLARAAALYVERHARADGKVPATVEIAYLLGWAPGPDQPKALRPGSAKTRLADALGVPERSAGEAAGE